MSSREPAFRQGQSKKGWSRSLSRALRLVCVFFCFVPHDVCKVVSSLCVTRCMSRESIRSKESGASTAQDLEPIHHQLVVVLSLCATDTMFKFAVVSCCLFRISVSHGICS